jgi:hypothetical protein
MDEFMAIDALSSTRSAAAVADERCSCSRARSSRRARRIMTNFTVRRRARHHHALRRCSTSLPTTPSRADHEKATMLEDVRPQRKGEKQMLFDGAGRMSKLYRKLETCGKPWVSAINGTCMGGAFEMSLACHGRVAADSPKRSRWRCPRSRSASSRAPAAPSACRA